MSVTRSPGKAFTPQPGEYAAASSRLALRLAGLPNRRLLVTRSPGKAFTPQPGEYAVTWHCCGFFPACAALSRATGPQIAGNP
ncbi:hypothetical protein FMK67_05735 [Klebsiella michiganensis]|nr:hypothetical protein C2U46_25045 [Klebsiella oxytoca]EUB40461.1 hypothetical protein HMPREF1502_5900 [Klebsiella sp. AS10]MBZ6664250.1 hypothetical protein [Klebsiella michiganensis]MBZ6743363.1 hypothetical protein [Klebsiella michiganensis]MBZ7234136.1 hypothetical protein [Klebsiella michiganensis]